MTTDSVRHPEPILQNDRWERRTRTERKRMIMPMSEIVPDTPYYVLLDGNHRIGPHIVQLHAGIECSPIHRLTFDPEANAYRVEKSSI
jgi:hypothetical protein